MGNAGKVAVAAILLGVFGTAAAIVVQGGSSTTASAIVLAAPGQVTYRESVWSGSVGYQIGGKQWSVFGRLRSQEWIPPSGNGRLIQTCLASGFPSKQDRAAWVAEGSQAQYGASIGGPACANNTSPLFADMLAPGPITGLTPAAIERKIDQQLIRQSVLGADKTAAEVDSALTVSADPNATPAQRAGMFVWATWRPGVIVRYHVRDRLGRSGTELLFSSGPTPRGDFQTAIIVDPATDLTLSETTTNLATAHVVAQSTLLRNTGVSAIGATR